jgi:molybdopterin-containing oxidoreductase family iron-sulfur binding subunit
MVRRAADRMNRLYALETMPTPTGTRADQRPALKPTENATDAGEIAALDRTDGSGLPAEARAGSTARAEVGGSGLPDRAKWIDALVRDLLAHRGTSLVVAGDHQPAAVHALAHAMNLALAHECPNHQGKAETAHL